MHSRQFNFSSVAIRSCGYLPHWEAKGGSYFATLRLADSLRQSAIDTFEFVRRDITRTAQWP
jgi:hypothetical protein